MSHSRLDSTMPDYSHAIFIDESGNGSDTDDINKYWVSAAIAIPFERMESIDEKVKSILKSNFGRIFEKSKERISRTD